MMKGLSMFASKGIMIMFSLVLVLLAFTGCASQSGTNGTQGNASPNQSSAPATTSGGSSANKEPFRFGASVPLTGSFAAYSKYFKNGLDLAVEEVNKSGGVNGRMLEVIYEDHKGEPSTGISTLQKMITKDKVNTVFLTMTGVAMAQLPIGDQSKVVMLTGAVTYPKYATSSEWSIQDSISVYSEAQRMVGYITD
jgi:branched-chain amino acid transport system substrate-binding protein